MQLPFDLNDVRMIAIDGDTVRFILSNGHVEISISRHAAARQVTPSTPFAPSIPTPSRTNAKHIMFEDGIYGI